MDLVVYAVPLFILAMVFELLWGLRVGRNTYRVNDAVSSLFLGTLSQARKFVTLGVGGYIYHLTTEYFSLPLMSAESLWTWVLAMVLYDFCYYWLHRMGHERTILWAAHVAHHQSEDYNLSTALRQTSTGFLLGWIFYLPMFALGIPAVVVVTVGSINLIYQFWVHTEHVGKLGWYEWIFVTPSNHRVHHAQNERYLDRNYGGLFILWDRLFGTFQEELDSDPPIYGIRGPLKSFNPLRALTHIYGDMLRDSWRAARWRDKLHVWVARNGWRPADVEARYPLNKPSLEAFERFDPPMSLGVKLYALFQLVAVVALLAYLQSGTLQSYGTGVALVLGMLWTTITTAYWMEGRSVTRGFVFDSLRLLGLCCGLLMMPATEPLNLAIAVYLWANLAILIAVAATVNGKENGQKLAEGPREEASGAGLVRKSAESLAEPSKPLNLT
ncbi:sterol desaturase family protein [Congregibacter litoralis]|uniref:Sterol desaturase n=1 Tax=Congregibacter litoralis KT71 TaxID=314285 RepID=A4A6C5_9GAMM|nr:sterol desaturase family protein [Congregibacter litoralis]EAQ98572.1 Sterol desaturase [Congregibacter litoralis KT71]